jgi:hypothetical protein
MGREFQIQNNMGVQHGTCNIILLHTRWESDRCPPFTYLPVPLVAELKFVIFCEGAITVTRNTQLVVYCAPHVHLKHTSDVLAA